MSDAWEQTAHMWDKLGSPLRPHVEDLQFIARWLPDAALGGSSPHVLVLGATPEYHSLPWPRQAQVTAIDRSMTMLGTVWPGSGAVCADWLAMPLASASIDLVLCDGGLLLQTWPEGQQLLALELARMLRPGGLLIMRSFVLPPRPESVANVLDELRAGRIANPNLLRLRLWMALQESPRAGVSNAAAWRLLEGAVPQVEPLAALMSVEPDYLRAEFAQPADRHYHIGDRASVEALFGADPGGFRLEEVHVPAYRCGDICPTHVFRRDGGPSLVKAAPKRL